MTPTSCHKRASNLKLHQADRTEEKINNKVTRLPTPSTTSKSRSSNVATIASRSTPPLENREQVEELKEASGPFRLDYEILGIDLFDDNELVEVPVRNTSCPFYDACLETTAALDWDSFTCRGCSGEPNQHLYWQALHSIRRDGVSHYLCKQIKGESVVELLVKVENG